ncbi:MAG: hypothetical protein ACYS6W_14625 [Planctomycetota bacterium]|jgi:hypothetical protein
MVDMKKALIIGGIAVGGFLLWKSTQKEVEVENTSANIPSQMTYFLPGSGTGTGISGGGGSGVPSFSFGGITFPTGSVFPTDTSGETFLMGTTSVKKTATAPSQAGAIAAAQQYGGLAGTHSSQFVSGTAGTKKAVAETGIGLQGTAYSEFQPLGIGTSPPVSSSTDYLSSLKDTSFLTKKVSQ